MTMMGMNGSSIQREKRKSAMIIGLDFDPEAIHVMRLNETEEEFDRRLEAYRRMKMMDNKLRVTLYAFRIMWILLFVVAPIVTRRLLFVF